MVYCIFFIMFFISCPGRLYSNELPYKNTIPAYEPRFDRDFLHSIDISVCIGGAHKGKDKDHHTTPLLDIYGVQDFYYTFLNYNKYPALPEGLTNEQITLITDFLTLAAADTTRTIGKVSFDGKFRYCSTTVFIIQNLVNGFFLEVLLPFSRVSTRDISGTHKSTTTDTKWTNFNNELDTILKVYNLSLAEHTTSGISDVTVLGGWTNNTETSDVFDFIDMSLRFGVSIPTANARSTTTAFSVPLGYNGHVGIPVVATVAWGLYDWLTLGGHVKGHYFLKTNGVHRARTNENETGYLTLRQTAARECLGSLWGIGTYFKADHIIRGFSLQCNYNYCIQEDSHLEPFDTDFFTNTIINTSEHLQKWSHHEIYCAAEYDFAQDDQQWNPHLKVFYAQQIYGRRTYSSKAGGFTAGIYIIVNF